MWGIVDRLVNCKNVRVDLIRWMALAMNQDVIVPDEVSVTMKPDCARVSRVFMATDANIKPRFGETPTARFPFLFVFLFFFFFSLLPSSVLLLFRLELRRTLSQMQKYKNNKNPTRKIDILYTQRRTNLT